MFEIIFLILLIGIPAAVIAWFIISLIKYLRTPKENKNDHRSRQTVLAVSGAVLGTLIAAFVSLAALLYLSIRYM